MSAIIWPSSLPQRPTIAGYGEAARASRVSFQPDVGAPIERRRGTVRTATITAQFVMTSEQVRTFRDFVHDTLSEASLEFLMPHPRTGEQARVRIAGGDQVYGVQWQGVGYWRVAVPLMVIE